jgi:16S rRNA (guanine527-N7)-methyltransferase
MNNDPLAPLTLANLDEQSRAAGFVLPEPALSVLREYLDLLMRWNASMNLVGAANWRDAFNTLIVDSLHLAAFLDTLPLPSDPYCADLGAGAGLPGIPLRAVWQSGTYTMIEAREKRALFISTALGAHPLPRTYIFRGRAEDFFKKATTSPTCIFSRAFLPWPKLLDFISPHMASGGICLLLGSEPIILTDKIHWKALNSLNYQANGKQRAITALHRQ